MRLWFYFAGFQMTVGTSEVPINPSEDHPPPKAPTISIPTESFNLSNGHLVKSYVLLLRVSCASNGLLMSNGDVDTGKDNDQVCVPVYFLAFVTKKV
jgi:polycomb protein SUZ12